MFIGLLISPFLLFWIPLYEEKPGQPDSYFGVTFCDGRLVLHIVTATVCFSACAHAMSRLEHLLAQRGSSLITSVCLHEYGSSLTNCSRKWLFPLGFPPKCDLRLLDVRLTTLSCPSRTLWGDPSTLTTTCSCDMR